MPLVKGESEANADIDEPEDIDEEVDAEGVDCILTNDTDAVRETDGVKVGSAVVDKVYWLESDGTLL